MGKRRVIFVNRYFHPDHSATSQLVSDLAFHLAARGWAVEVVTSRQLYDDAGARLVSTETVRGVTIHRIRTTTFGRMFLAGRALDYLTFYLGALVTLTRRARRDTILVAMTDPPLISTVCSLATLLRGAILVNWIQDLFPEVAVELGVLRRGAGALKAIRNWSLRRARSNVVLGDLMAERVRSLIGSRDGRRVVIRHNWAMEEVETIGSIENRFRIEWGLSDRFVVAYSGNLGRAHDFSVMLAAIRALPQVDFVIIGGGAQLGAIRAATEDLPNVQFHPYQPRELLSASLSAADAHFITLRPELEGLIVPSKFYGVLAAGRAAIFAGSDDGELARIIRRSECGVVVSSSDSSDLVHSIGELAANRSEARVKGQRARQLYEKEFNAATAHDHWDVILDEARNA
jgi:colanic acid biosynthesis glycosyl transferase WcaI